MSKPRTELQSKLEEILGSRNVYFQPPDGLQIKYPCIVYNLSRIDILRADDMSYMRHKGYFITIMDKKPTSEIYERILEEFPMSRLDHTAVIEKINHWYITVFW